MHEKMCTLLNAYLDGELHGQPLRELEMHLSSCPDCRNELTELRLVSNLLQADAALEVNSVDRFVSQLTLRLPRRNMKNQPTKPASNAWWLVPVGLLGAWFFVQSVFTLTNLISAANISGLLGHAAGWLTSGVQDSIWFSTATSFFGRQAAGALPTLSLLNSASLLAGNLVGGFLWQAVIVFLYWSWLFLWWLRHRPQPMMLGNAAQ